MNLKPAVSGDVGDERILQVTGIDNLSAVTAVEAHVWKPNSTQATLTAAVTDPDEATVTVQLGAVDGWLATAAAGRWKFELEFTFADGDVITWPSGNPDTIDVRAAGE